MNDKFTSKLENLGLNKSEKIAVAVSGGSDSTALCFLCHQAKLKFIPIIVDHGWRKNSAKEAKQVKKYLEDRKIKAAILTNKKPIPKNNIEEFLRDVRYELLFDFCKKNGIKKILTAHHLDDQIETFLMRLERGSGLDGLTGIKERNKVKGFELIRPLLDFTKEELVAYLKKNKIKWIEDPSNENIELTRNNIRKTLQGFSDYELMRKRISGVIANIDRAKNFIEEEKEKTAKQLIKAQKSGSVTLNLTGYRKLHSEIRLRILRDLIKKHSKTKKDVRMDSIKNLDNNLLNKNFKTATLHGLKIARKAENLACFE